MPRVVFMGTPEFAVPALDALVEAGFDVCGAITQPDRPRGRGKKVSACPVKARAEALGIPTFAFEKLKSPEGVACLRSLRPDVAVTAAFGQILTEELLSVPAFGVINVHASLLPRHRGSAPIQWALLMGDDETGVSLMRTERGLDTGPVYASESTPIFESDTAVTLTERLSRMGASLLAAHLPDILSGALQPVPQQEALSTYEPMLTKALSPLDFARDAASLARQVRALNPWPGAKAGELKVWAARALEGACDAPPGTVVCASAKDGLVVACADGLLSLDEIQAPGARRMAAAAYLAGKKIETGTEISHALPS